MTYLNSVKFCLFVGLVLSAGCGGGKSVDDENVALAQQDLLIGVWLKPVADTNGFDGLQFDADGQVHYLNMFTIMGDHWQRVGLEGLDISSHTERYPEPESDHLVIKILTSTQLVLVPLDSPGAEGVVYQRAPSDKPADRMLGRWGTVEGRFFDVTPEGDAYRIVEKNLQEFKVMIGRPTGEGMIVDKVGHSWTVTLVEGRDTGRDDWQDSENCLKIEDTFYLCR